MFDVGTFHADPHQGNIMFTMLGRAILSFEGVIEHLCPELDLFELFIGSCILTTVDIQPKTSNGIPLIAMAGIIFAISLAIYSVSKLTNKK